MTSEPAKRFFDLATARQDDGGFGIWLDQRRLKTPARAAFTVPTAALAEAVAEEWNAQGAKVEPRAMPLTGLANAAIDRITPEREPFAARLAQYGEHDLLCYRAESPVELVARQARAWQPVLDWLAVTHGARLTLAEGIVHVDQPPEAREAQHRAILAHSHHHLAGLHVITTSTGSLSLGLAVLGGLLTAEEAFALSRIDEDYQAERWGSDAEAETRAADIRAEIAAAGRFIALLK
jgi:chaperone required for assembly of F1-ATPase